MSRNGSTAPVLTEPAVDRQALEEVSDLVHEPMPECAKCRGVERKWRSTPTVDLTHGRIPPAVLSP
jgi:hypothetical protein